MDASEVDEVALKNILVRARPCSAVAVAFLILPMGSFEQGATVVDFVVPVQNLTILGDMGHDNSL